MARSRAAPGTTSEVMTGMAKAEYGLGELREKDGKWYGRWLSPSGRYRNRLVGAAGRDGLKRPEARKRLMAMMEEDGARPSEADNAPTVAVLGKMLETRLTNLDRSDSQLEAVESCVRVHIAPYFKETPIDAIDEGDVEAFMAALRKKGLAPKSVANYVSVLHSIFELAIRKHYVTVNAVKMVDRARPKGGNRDIRFLSLEELDAVIAHAEDDDLGRMERVLWLGCATEGFRMGETRGFRWRDVDWEAMRVRVRQNHVRGKFKDPKSREGVRSVPLALRFARELELLYQRTAWQGDDDLVFCHPHTGGPYDGSKALKRFKAAQKRAGITKVNDAGKTVGRHRLHDLRHTFGTRMAAQGVPMRTLQAWMGHEDFETTLIYADYAPGAHEAEWINAAFPASLADAPDGVRVEVQGGD